MKRAIICLFLILFLGSWAAKKVFERYSTSTNELERFQEYAKDYDPDTTIFLNYQAKRLHDKAFDQSYKMWKLSPISELDLSSHYDEKAYYNNLATMLYKKAIEHGNDDARNALIDIAQYYGITPNHENSSNKKSPPQKNNKPSDTSQASPLGKSKLGDKRAIPRRTRDHER